MAKRIVVVVLVSPVLGMARAIGQSHRWPASEEGPSPPRPIVVRGGRGTDGGGAFPDRHARPGAARCSRWGRAGSSAS